jgi:hypothetical protein
MYEKDLAKQVRTTTENVLDMSQTSVKNQQKGANAASNGNLMEWNKGAIAALHEQTNKHSNDLK